MAASQSVTTAMERTEARIWATYFDAHSNDALRGCGVFLAEIYDLGTSPPMGTEPTYTHCLTSSQHDELKVWLKHFTHHSHPGLQELAQWLPQWYPCLREVA